jgi:hypothetical protein
MTGSASNKGLRPATPPASKGPRRQMPRQHRDAAPAPSTATRRVGFARITILWVVIFVASSAGAWYFGSEKSATTDLAKKVSPFAGTDVGTMRFTRDGKVIEFARSPEGKFERVGVPPTPVPEPTAVPAPGATPAIPTVVIAPGARIESFANQLHDLPVDRVVATTPSDSAEYGLDKPVLLIEVVAKAGGSAKFAVGGKGVGESTYYVRRDAKEVNDTIIASKYTIDEMLRFAAEQAALP